MEFRLNCLQFVIWNAYLFKIFPPPLKVIADWEENGVASYGLTTDVADATSEFHVYALEWDEDFIRIFVDDTQYYELATNSSMPFDNDFFMILNVAMGGTLGGTIDPNFTEDTMEVDYVRVYQ